MGWTFSDVSVWRRGGSPLASSPWASSGPRTRISVKTSDQKFANHCGQTDAALSRPVGGIPTRSPTRFLKACDGLGRGATEREVGRGSDGLPTVARVDQARAKVGAPDRIRTFRHPSHFTCTLRKVLMFLAIFHLRVGARGNSAEPRLTRTHTPADAPRQG
jgi:hypothetical protein